MRLGIPPTLVCGCVLLVACADYDGTVHSRSPGLDDARESRCSVVKDHSRPLIVEWPASARGDLEVRMTKGAVAVRYVGCAMEVLDRCTAGGTYRYTPFTPNEDRLVIRDSKDLYANLPMGAAGLEAKLKSLGEIDLGMTLVGKYEVDAALAREEDLRGDCTEATHIVTGMTVGAFALSAGGTLDVGAGGTVLGVGAKVSAANERETLSRDGDARMCMKATLDDTKPPRWCGAVVRVEVVPVARSLAPAPAARETDARAAEVREAEGLTVPSLPTRLTSTTREVVGLLSDRIDPKAPPATLGERSPTRKWRPSPCDGSSVSDCMARCTDGSGPSCLSLAHASPKDRTYWFVYACIGGSAEGCTGVGKAYARGEFGDPDEFTAEKWYGIAASLRP
jgi:hypothetical protein